MLREPAAPAELAGVVASTAVVDTRLLPRVAPSRVSGGATRVSPQPLLGAEGGAACSHRTDLKALEFDRQRAQHKEDDNAVDT